MIKETSLITLKQNVQILEIISNYLVLRKSGSNYTACCPFHDEKTPSFIVSPSKNIYHCYGCGAGGDAIGFVEKIDNLSFTEAVEKIADMMGFTLEFSKSTNKDSGIFAFLEKIQGHFKDNLKSNTEARLYLQNRGLKSETIEKFGIGYVDANYSVINYIDNIKARKEAVEVGFLLYENANIYSRFSNRITFPIFLPNDKIVGFGGRSLDKDAKAKYLNSAQSKIFNKSSIFYGYNFAKSAIYKSAQIIICEGYLDVIMLHQAGINNAVATLGTALTPSHLPLLAKDGINEVVLSFDGDSAGIKAALKASTLLAHNNIYGKVVIIKDGKDPADIAKEGRIEEFKNQIAKADNLIEFTIKNIANSYDLNNIAKKEAALKAVLEFTSKLSAIYQEEYKSFICQALNIKAHILPTINKPTNKVRKNDFNFNASLLASEELILKYMLEDENAIDFMLNFINEDIFIYKKAEFQEILRGNLDSSKLTAIALNDLLLINFNHLQEHLREFILGAYKRQKIALDNAKMPLLQKIEINKKIQEKIFKLQKGELVLYESFSLI